MTVECVISQKFHRTVMGQRGCKVQEITREHEVAIKFPDRPTEGDCKYTIRILCLQTKAILRHFCGFKMVL